MKPRKLIIKDEFVLVPLTQNQISIIDLCDVHQVSKFNWFADFKKRTNSYYARSNHNRKLVYLHRFILQVTNPKIEVDHINGNGLNCRRNNMRICTRSQNNMNCRPRRNTISNFKGVPFSKAMKKWEAYISHNNKFIRLGYFDNEIDAAIVYNNKAKELFGEFAKLNDI